MPHKRSNGKWAAVVYVRGSRTTRTCPTKKAALQLEAKYTDEAWRVRNGLVSVDQLVAIEKGRRRVLSALEDHIEDLRHRGRTWAHCDERQRVCEKVLCGSGISSCNTITQDALMEYIHRESKGKSARTYNSLLLHTKAFCRWLKQHQFIAEHPLEYVSSIEDPGSANPSRVLTVDEVNRILQTPGREAFYTFVFFTGFRWGARRDGGEAARLRWEWVDLAGAEMLIPIKGITKNGKTERVPLPSIVVDALASDRRIGGRIFPTVPTRKTWNRQLERVGIVSSNADGTAHRKSTRKTFSNRIAEAGIDDLMNARLMRHSDILVTKTYRQKTDEVLEQERRALEKMVSFHLSKGGNLSLTA